MPLPDDALRAPPDRAPIRREVLVFVCRATGPELRVLLARRCRKLGGYWHTIAGAVDQGETDEQAALRELREETGLDARGRVASQRCTFSYTVAGGALHTAEVTHVSCFRVDAPRSWEPQLDWEHDESRWCDLDEAVRLLHWPLVARALSRLVRS